jgi:holin-like protein
MRLIRQFLIILGVSFAGEVLSFLLPLPIPASIYGLVLMLILLLTGLVKLHQVKTAADFMIEIMPLMFIGPSVGLMESLPALKAMLLPLTVILVVSTVVTMAATGLTAQSLIRRSRRAAKNGQEETSHE